MRRNLTLSLGLLCCALGLRAQTTFTDDFESYTLGSYVAASNNAWTTWSNAPGTSEDAMVVNTQAASGTQSAYFHATSTNGGPTDLVLPFGGQYNTGDFHLDMNMRVNSGEGAYFNFQAQTVIGTQWALEIHMDESGNMECSNTSGTFLTTTYPTGTWFNLAFDVNLNTNEWEVSIDNVSQGIFANTVNQIASMDIYPVNNNGNGQSTFWVDDVNFSYTPYTLPNVNAAVVALGSIDPATRAPGNVTGLVGQSKTVAATVRNLGVTAITSFDLGYTYNSGSGNTSITGVNIPSLGSQIVTFTTPVTLATGTNNLVVTVSNVNGAGQDGDPNDDQGTRAVSISAVPAADKIVVGEEGTGTWCQWCPRGAVYMDYMHDTYDGYWAGIAVHNQDPMTMTDYDGPFSGFLSGYPGCLVERGTEIDPSDLEHDFLQKIQVAPTAALVNGAVWNSGTRQLDVSVTYNFSGSANQNWKVLCVLTEDSVTGTTALYAQSNAYSNNAVGPMGGFENLPASVPAAQMNYNHVARALTPNFGGFNGFTGPVNSGAIHTFNYSFNLPNDWDENQIHIIGMLINDLGEIDNGSHTSIAQAVSNGFTAGTLITGITQIAGPDAEVSLFPNPTTDMAYVTLNLQSEVEVSLALTDLQGRQIASQNYGLLNGGQRLPLNTDGLAAGVYFVRVQMGDKLNVQRLVVE
ncbi:MAG: Omp28-related outer membrane protein [Bacteroidia bacterium]